MLSSKEDRCLQVKAINFLLLIDFTAFFMGSRVSLSKPLCVIASVRENEDLVNGLLRSSDEFLRVII
jgi:hypothetical protein